MNSIFFSRDIEGQTVHGLVELPGDHRETDKKAIVFLHGMGGYRTGPHDMFVYFSGKFAQRGYHCVRFDFRGKGYSGDARFVTSAASMLDDIQAVVDYVKDELKIANISLCGICLGAKLALYYAKSKGSIQDLFLLSSVPLRNDEVSRSIAHKQVRIYASEYIRKLFQPKTWVKVFSGQIHGKEICKRVFRPYLSRQGAQRGGAAGGADFLSAVRMAVVVHAERDPDTWVAKPQIEDVLSVHQIQYHSEIIPGANHSFYSTEWTRKIWNIIDANVYVE